MASVYKTKDRNGKVRSAWRFKYKDHTGKWRYGTGWPDKKRTEEHVQALEAEHRAIRKGEKELPPAWLEKRNTPIQDVISEYMAWGEAQGGRGSYGWSKGHMEHRRCGLRFWVKELSLRTLTDVDLGSVEVVMRKLIKRNLTRKTVNAYIESIKALCIWSVKHGYLKENPLAGLASLDSTPECPHRALSDDEVKRLLNVTPAKRALVYKTALATGYRAGELRALRVQDLDLFGPSLHLSAEFTKNRKDARQPITRALADELSELTKGKTPDDPLMDMPQTETVSENFKRDCAAASIVRKTAAGKATFHSFRVNYINAVVESGSDLKTIMTLARHGSAQMSMEVYAKPNPERLWAAVEAVSDRLEEAISEVSCCTSVARAVAGSKEDAITPSADKDYGKSEVVSPWGFEPQFVG